MFSAGMVLLEMCCKFKTGHHRLNAFTNLRQHQQFPASMKEMDHEKIIISNLTQGNYHKRMSAADLLDSPTLKMWAML